ncbi:DUF2249 domain-containing protein [Halosimplex aquaticum]|uniref:DUF2249 domain-containing protein n=1 Tax=Halosimplex aquaticum TaxID=3026162 RepID=A0ABD5Y4K1_9EURY|nr:DUF2249 domain-containing protein [Halosimplex aquaticum]
MAADESTEATRTLDAREIDGEPFGDITSALGDLPEDGTLRLINSFEPEPLYGVLAERGFTHETEQVADDEWHVYIRHADGE